MIDALPLLLGPEGYQISRSVRLRSSASAYLNRTPASAGNRKTWTWSAWVKRGSIGGIQTLFKAFVSSSDSFAVYFGSDNISFGNDTGSIGTSSVAVSRDPSAWYHIVFALDTTQATASNRCKLYVNGVLATLNTLNAPTQNADLTINAASVSHTLGGVPSYYFDGYLTEVNFIDGQALTPSSFGETNTVTGVWQPKKYAGTYGTNGFYLPFLQNTTATYGATFNGSSQYLTVPASSLFAPGTGDFTLEAWVNTASATDGQYVWSQTVSGTNYFVFSVDAAAKRASFVATTSGGGTPITSTANLVVGGWNHVAVVRQSGTVTVYCNGVGGTPTSNTMDINNTTYVPTIGRYTHSASQWFNGVISNLRYVKGTAVYTSNFTPASAPLTAISGTSFLSLQSSTLVDNSVNALTITNNGSVATSIQYPFNTGTSIGNDQSGQGNNWTPNNISLANNSTYDSMLDVPTQWADGGNGRGNYCTFNPLVGTHSNTYSNGNLQVATSTANAAFSNQRATFGVSSGKWYWEITCQATSSAFYVIGITADTVNPDTQYIGQGNSYSYRSDTGQKATNGTFSTYGATFTTGDIIGVEFDADAGTLVFYKNNVSQGTAFTSISGTYFPAVSDLDNNTGRNSTFVANFGQRPFAYTPPSGFKALNTLNLPTPTILKGNQYFDATLWDGNSTNARVITTNVGTVDFAWVKKRNGADDHRLANTVTGGNRHLQSNTTAAESTGTTVIQAFSGSTFTLGTDNSVNATGGTYVGWTWAEGATQGFDIVTYTGNGGTGASSQVINHSLGVLPSMAIIKSRSAASTNWLVEHISLTAGGYALALNVTGAQSGPFPNDYRFAQRTSSTYQVGSTGGSTRSNANGETYVAYLFAEVAGFSKFGSYTGNGSADGPFVFCGFRPRFIMVKRTDSTGNWFIWDTARDPYNTILRELYPDSSSAEVTRTGSSDSLDALSNGFKMRFSSTYADRNANGGTYIFAAFAEHPFKNALAR